jgi:hypothetical protein
MKRVVAMIKRAIKKILPVAMAASIGCSTANSFLKTHMKIGRKLEVKKEVKAEKRKIDFDKLKEEEKIALFSRIEAPNFFKIKNRNERISKALEFLDKYLDLYLSFFPKGVFSKDEIKKRFLMILAHESGFDPLAYNPNSKDYGIGQLNEKNVWKLKRGDFPFDIVKIFRKVPAHKIRWDLKYNLLGCLVVFMDELYRFKNFDLEILSS